MSASSKPAKPPVENPMQQMIMNLQNQLRVEQTKVKAGNGALSSAIDDNLGLRTNLILCQEQIQAMQVQLEKLTEENKKLKEVPDAEKLVELTTENERLNRVVAALDTELVRAKAEITALTAEKEATTGVAPTNPTEESDAA